MPRTARPSPPRARRASSTTSSPVDPDILTPEEAAAVLKVQPSTLKKWRSRGDGPRFSRKGNMIRYRRSKIDEWLASQEVESSADGAPYVPAGRR